MLVALEVEVEDISFYLDNFTHDTPHCSLHHTRSSNQTGIFTNVQEVNNRFEVTHWAGMQVEAAGGGGEQQECGDDISSCLESDLKVGTSIK